MSAMLAAIKKRKEASPPQEGGDHQHMGHAAQHADDPKDLHGLVASLSSSEKHNLKSILDNDKGAMAINKGEPSSEEKGKIEAAIGEENQESSLEEQQESPSHDSDEIARSMLDSRHLGSNPPQGKPRNLGERMKMSLASKLKGKGKI